VTLLHRFLCKGFHVVDVLLNGSLQSRARDQFRVIVGRIIQLQNAIGENGENDQGEQKTVESHDTFPFVRVTFNKPLSHTFPRW